MSRKFVSGGGYRLKGLGTTKVSRHGIFRLKTSTLLTSLSLIALFALSAFSLSSILYPSAPSSANSSSASSSSTLAVGASVQEFLRLAVDVSEVALADSQGHTTISPDPNTGTEITGDINVAVTTNTGNGYNLTVATQDNTKNMTHSLPTVDTAINSIDSISGYDASTGASNLSNNTWGFRKNTGTVQEPVYTNWYAVGAKDSTGTVIDSPGEGTGSYCDSLSYPLNQSGCNPSSYRTYNINVGAKLTSALPAGTYTNDIVFSATTKSEGTKYTMNFNSNGGNNGNIINPRIVIAGLSTILPTSGFTKDGYGIKGWAFKSGVTPSTANTSADTTMYNAGQSVAINDLLTAALNAGQNPSTNNSFTVYAVWETAYTINFNKNSNEAIGSMNPDTPIIQSATYTIPNATFTREGYNFLGWALTSGATTATYTAGQTLTVSSLITAAQAAGQSVTPGTAGTITLYAIWEEATVYMQNFDCNSRLTSIGASMTVRDSRDNTDYVVKKLQDGKCWMIENLTISATGMVVDSLDNTNTNIPSNDSTKYYLPPRNTRYATANSITNSAVKTASDSLDFSTSNSNQPQIGYRAAGSTDNQTGNPVPENTAYYPYYTASLGFSYYQDDKTSGSSPRDICPKGWHLPFVSNGGTTVTTPASSEFANLARTYNGSATWQGNGDTNSYYYTSDTTIRSNMISGDSGSIDRYGNNGAAGFTYAGLYNSTTLNSVGTNGTYWSSSVYTTYGSYSLNFNTTNVSPQDYGNKRFGFAVRCVAGS